MGGVHLIMRFSCKKLVPVYSVYPLYWCGNA